MQMIRTYSKPWALIYEVIGFPRHLSQHVGGFIVTEGRLDELVPIENRHDGRSYLNLLGQR